MSNASKIALDLIKNSPLLEHLDMTVMNWLPTHFEAISTVSLQKSLEHHLKKLCILLDCLHMLKLECRNKYAAAS